MTTHNFDYDAIIIGGGPGGYVCAIRLAQLGFKVCCVEKDKTLGGTCLNVGCIPSKALLESSHLWHKANHEFKDHGIELKGLNFQLEKIIKRKDQVVSQITGGVDYLFKKNKIDRLQGFASLTGKNEVSIDSQKKITSKKIILATGSVPVEIPIAKYDHKTIVDSTDALKFSKVPKHLIVLGGGVIGLELGSVWSRLGAKVTVIEALDSILPTMDKTVSASLQKILKKQGMEFLLGTKLTEAKSSKDSVKVKCIKGSEEFEIKGDKLLVCVGRKPFTEKLGLDAVGIETNSMRQIKVNEKYQTQCPNIYAIGDVIHGPMLAHKAEEEGICVAELIADKFGHVNYAAIPGIVYTWPEIASVGKTEQECKEQNIPIKIGKFNFKANGRAKAMGETDGVVKMIGHKETDELLGCHIIGPMASEMISEIVIGIEYKASCEDIARSVHAHPTLAESIKEAALDTDNIAIHS